jgi:signal transduction histidine kinase
VLSTIEDVTDWRRLEKEIIDIGDRERRKIGQDLHDDLGPHLIGIEVLSKVLQKKHFAQHLDTDEVLSKVLQKKLEEQSVEEA